MWRLAIAFVAFLASLAVPHAVSASTFFAAPEADGAFPCARADPCPLPLAVEQASDTDEVIVLPGTYELAQTLEIDFGNVHGRPGRPARLVVADNPAVSVAFTDPRVADLIVRSTTGQALNAGLSEATFERLRVIGASDNPVAPACTIPEAPGIMRDTVCVNTGAAAAIGIGVFAGAVITIEYHLVNVTALATSTSPDAHGLTFLASGNLTMMPHVTNSILTGGPKAVDVLTERGAATATVNLTLANSNFDTSNQGTGTTILSAGGNQLDPPVFVDPDAFDLRQLATSPTINGGKLAPGHAALGALDFEGDRRRFGPRPDIGADEFTGILDVKARKRQDLEHIRFKATCPLTSCRLKASADGLEREKVKLKAGRTKTVRLKPEDGASLGDKLLINVTARDTVGARERERLRIRAKG